MFGFLPSLRVAACGRLLRVVCASLAGLGLSLTLAGCGHGEADKASSADAVPDDGNQRYPLTGKVISVDAEHQTVRILHDDIKGLMPSMTMDFRVALGDVTAYHAGERVRATLVRTPDSDFYLENVWPDDQVADATVAAAARDLRQDTNIRGRGAYREVGETAPDFALYDQDGRVVVGSRFRGRQVVLNFIFTRCPVPTMCPAATARMQQLQAAARKAGVKDLELVSVSLDPKYDTPAVLKAYAIQKGIDTSNFSLLTGPEGAVGDLLTQFGILVNRDNPLPSHTLSTVLINRGGKIIWRVDGSTWDINEFLSRLRTDGPDASESPAATSDAVAPAPADAPAATHSSAGTPAS